MPVRISFHFDPCPPDSFVLTPAVIVTQARCECCDAPAPAFRLSLDWLLWSAAVEIVFPTASH
jgi:hypothetical protein